MFDGFEEACHWFEREGELAINPVVCDGMVVILIHSTEATSSQILSMSPRPRGLFLSVTDAVGTRSLLIDVTH